MKEYQDIYKTAGAFSWTELMTSDPRAATEFYGALFGWTFGTMSMGQGDYHVVKIGDTSIGGIMATPPQAQGMPPAWGAYVTVASADAAAEKCTSLGGKVLAGPMDIPSVGRFAVLQDPQGAVFHVIAYASS
ncbi:MAG: VOC family protein [Candidatus Eisenbacteria bacterium]|uniref:VOC family protein n=1 Tax=Eiseniibacteriota bacterium TaxID=2212470 RepID=A0A938BQH6_UNCEI|nr:VOC family protein [Candidatus Eisenbacteria bacterium]